MFCTMAASESKDEDNVMLPAHLTVPYTLGCFAEEEEQDTIANEEGKDSLSGTAAEEEKEWTDDDVIQRLNSHGVTVESDAQHDPSSQDLRRTTLRKILNCKMISTSSFWQKHHSLHPNARRVKNWLWVHQRYRAQAKDMLDEASTKEPMKLSAEFQKFHKKIESHSTFEDTQLFQYFLDAKIGDQVTLKKLKEQHSDIKSVEAIRDGLQKLSSDTTSTYDTSVKDHLERYVQDMLDHLDLEEKTIVGPWLLLTDEEYQKYRSYLSWTYCVMY